jgi:hypothetical protein
MYGEFDATRLSYVLGAIQHGVGHGARGAIAHRLIEATNRILPPEFRNPQAPDAEAAARLQALQDRGVVELGQVLNPDQVGAVVAYFRSRPCFGAHVAGKSDRVGRTVEECATRGHYGSYTIEDVLKAPFLPEIANREDILSLAESYLGCPPTLYSVNAFWSFPEQSRPWAGIQTFHRDFDDFRFCTMFLFLTDLTADNGAHYYIPGTHKPEFVEKIVAEKLAANPALQIDQGSLFTENADLNDVCALLFSDIVQTVTMPAGGAVIEDTYGLHKGDIPKSPRLVVWLRYGLYKNLTNQRDHIVPLARNSLVGRIPDTPRHKFINRLMVEP